MMLERNILLCVTGGIAAFKAVQLLRLLSRAGARVRVIMTRSATRFVGPLTFEALSGNPVLVDLWEAGSKGGESHISLTDWADVIAVVPATANSIARFAMGLADDLVSVTMLAAGSPTVVAPAMHARMLSHPATQANIAALRARGVRLVDPVEGDLASGEGPGRMAEPEEIFEAIAGLLEPQGLRGHKVVVTAGPTVEPIDPIRHVTNRSSGKMGFAIATVARRRGGAVTLVTGPTLLAPPSGVRVVNVETAAEMHAAVMAESEGAAAVVMAAAVADYTQPEPAPKKIKKSDEPLLLRLTPTSDILAELGQRRVAGAPGTEAGPVLVGFAMETEELEANAAKKMKRKGCDLMVANDVTEPGAGFGVDTNRVTLFFRDGRTERLPLLSKLEVAGRLLDHVATLIQHRYTGEPAHGRT